jgi:outer membrane lipoprotein carrier protein
MAFSQDTPLTDAEQVRFMKEVAGKASDLESLSSDFTQTKFIQLMEDKAVSKGKLYYKAPNVLKWEYSSPYDYKVLFRENQLHINDNGDKSVTNLRANKLMEKLVGLISGSVNGKLVADYENFDVSFTRNGKSVTAVIIPKDPSIKQMFHEIIMVFNQDNILNSVRLMEEGGDYTHIDFKNIKINASIEKSIFEN